VTAQVPTTGALDGGGRWWPSPFGAGDQLGMLNHVDAAKRLEDLRAVPHCAR